MTLPIVQDQGRPDPDTGVSGASEVQAGTRSRERPVDLVYLTRQTLGDAHLADEILGLMLRQITLFESRLGCAGADERRQIAHALKGAARTVGAFPLAWAAARLEADPSDAALVAVLGAEMARVGVFIHALRT